MAHQSLREACEMSAGTRENNYNRNRGKSGGGGGGLATTSQRMHWTARKSDTLHVERSRCVPLYDGGLRCESMCVNRVVKEQAFGPSEVTDVADNMTRDQDNFIFFSRTIDNAEGVVFI